MIISVRVSDMIESYKKYLETKLGASLTEQQSFIKDLNGVESNPEFKDFFMRFGTQGEKLPWLKL